MLNGYCHGLVLNLNSNNLILFSDRYGIHKIYYLETKYAFYFSYQIKPLIMAVPGSNTLSVPALAELFAGNHIRDNKTLFGRVREIPGGTFFKFVDAHLKEDKQYFDPKSLISQTILEKEFFYERFQYTLKSILKRYFKSEDNFAVYITEDSSVKILIENALFGPEKVPCYTAVGAYCYPQGLINAEKITADTKQPLKRISLGTDFIENLYSFCVGAVAISGGKICEDGAAELYISKLAREISPIQISSSYSDLIFNKKNAVKIYQNSFKGFNKQFQEMINIANEENEDKAPNYLGCCNSVDRFLNIELLPLIRGTQLVTRSPFLDNDLVDLAFRALSEYLYFDDMYSGLNDNKDKFWSSWQSKVRNIRYLLSSLVAGLHFGHFKSIGKSQSMVGRRFWDSPKVLKFIQEILSDPSSLGRPYLDKRTIDNIIKDKNFLNRSFTTDISMLFHAEIINRVFVDLN